MKFTLVLMSLLFTVSAFAKEVTVCGMADAREGDEHSITLKYSKKVQKKVDWLVDSKDKIQDNFKSIVITDLKFYNLVADKLKAMNPYTAERSDWDKGYDGVNLLICVTGKVSSVDKDEDEIELDKVDFKTLEMWDLDRL